MTENMINTADSSTLASSSTPKNGSEKPEELGKLTSSKILSLVAEWILLLTPAIFIGKIILSSGLTRWLTNFVDFSVRGYYIGCRRKTHQGECSRPADGTNSEIGPLNPSSNPCGSSSHISLGSNDISAAFCGSSCPERQQSRAICLSAWYKAKSN